MDERPKTEPTAAQRTAAREMWGNYVALVDVGFTHDQALTIVGQMLAAAIANRRDRPQDGDAGA